MGLLSGEEPVRSQENSHGVLGEMRYDKKFMAFAFAYSPTMPVYSCILCETPWAGCEILFDRLK